MPAANHLQKRDPTEASTEERQESATRKGVPTPRPFWHKTLASVYGPRRVSHPETLAVPRVGVATDAARKAGAETVARRQLSLNGERDEYESLHSERGRRDWSS